MRLTFDPFRLLLICLAGWLNQQQQDAIDYLHFNPTKSTAPNSTTALDVRVATASAFDGLPGNVSTAEPSPPRGTAQFRAKGLLCLAKLSYTRKMNDLAQSSIRLFR